MFTGIIEGLGEVTGIEPEGGNLNITISSDFTQELQIDQSIAHNGVCMTVVSIHESTYCMTAISETVARSNFQTLQVGDQINLERSVKAGGRLDGHIVQGHVDCAGTINSIEETEGSWMFKIGHPGTGMIVEKGSVSVNGVSLTVVECNDNEFSVAIIPYTFEHTNFHRMTVGDLVNIEYDILGKYVLEAIRQTSG